MHVGCKKFEVRTTPRLSCRGTRRYPITIFLSIVHHERDISQAINHPKDNNIHPILADIQGRITVSSARLFHASVPLDGRPGRLRNFETNLGNMLADAVRSYFDPTLHSSIQVVYGAIE